MVIEGEGGQHDIRVSEARTFQEALLAEIDPFYPIGGAEHILSPSVKEAYFACPRHEFVRRFRHVPYGPVHELTKDNMHEHLQGIYSGFPQLYVDKFGNSLNSTNSHPGFMLCILECLKVRKGTRVLEVGSGGGWFLSLLSFLVGPNGKAVGVEINEELAGESRVSLENVLRPQGFDNFRIECGDGALGWREDAPYDCIVINAAVREIPEALINQLRDGGRLAVPLSNQGGGEEMFILRKRGNVLHSEESMFCQYVSPSAALANGRTDAVLLRENEIWRAHQNEPSSRQKMWFGGAGTRDLDTRSYRFRTYLEKTDPNYAVFSTDGAGKSSKRFDFAFGVYLPKQGSLAVVRGDELIGYGLPAATRRLIASYRRWTTRFMPCGRNFALSVYPLSTTLSVSKGQYVEKRGSRRFIWTEEAGLKDE